MTAVAYSFSGKFTRREVEGLPPPVREKLTRRQAETCELVAIGWQNKRIAAHLNIKECTVRLYVNEVLERLGLDRSNDPRVEIARHILIAWMEYDEAA